MDGGYEFKNIAITPFADLRGPLTNNPSRTSTYPQPSVCCAFSVGRNVFPGSATSAASTFLPPTKDNVPEPPDSVSNPRTSPLLSTLTAPNGEDTISFVSAEIPVLNKFEPLVGMGNPDDSLTHQGNNIFLQRPTTRTSNTTKVKYYNSDVFSFPRFIYANAESLNFDKVAELESLAQATKASVLMVSEVHRQNPELLKIGGFDEFIKIRPDDHPLGKKGGGVLIYAHEIFKAARLDVPFLTEYDEIMWVILKPRRLPRKFTGIALCVYYYSPGQTSEYRQAFVEKLQLSSDFVLGKYPSCGIFMMGDANELKLHHLDAGIGLKQLVNFPTTKGGTSLDRISTNMHEFYNIPTTGAPIGGSYHFSLELNPTCSIKIDYTTTVTISRPITSEGLLTFGQWLSCEKWEKFQDAKSSNEKATIFQEALLHNYKACFPEKSTKRFSSDRPYITQEVKKMVMEKRWLFRQGNTQQANRLKNKLRKVTRKHANKYVERKVNHLFESKPSQWYNRIKRMTGKVEKGVDFGIDEDDVVTANSLNKHLGNIVQSLPPLLSVGIPTPPPESFDFPLISESQVFFKLKRLKRTSITPVDIPIDLIKAFPDYLSGPLTLLFNQVTKTGEYPSIWKNGFITPIPKKDAPNDFSGVRPITMTPIFSKVYESFVAAWLKDRILDKIDPKASLEICQTHLHLIT